MQNIFSEVLRSTFPKKLRFDQASQILYAQCFSLCRQHRSRKYIPLSSVEAITAAYTYIPCRPWLRYPVIRHILFIRVINSIRCYRGKPSWLYNRGVEEEYDKIVTWCAKQKRSMIRPSRGSTRHAPNSGTERLVERELFEKEVVNNFFVATMYQRIARILIIIALFLILLCFVAMHVDDIIFLFMRCRGWTRRDTLEWFRRVVVRHAVADVPPAYASLLPSPCVVRPISDGINELAVSAVELELPRMGVTVLAIPVPSIGPKSFFSRIGRICSECDAIVMEGVNFDKIDKMVPALLLPLRDPTFPALGMHHRFLDILQSDREPPMLYPGGPTIGWRRFFHHVFTPFEVQSVYYPTMLSSSKGEAKVGWGRLRELVERHCSEVEALRRSKGIKQSGESRPPMRQYVICVPWTIQHIVNIEASLVRYGFQVRRVFALPWMHENELGENFCHYYGIQEDS